MASNQSTVDLLMEIEADNERRPPGPPVAVVDDDEGPAMVKIACAGRTVEIPHDDFKTVVDLAGYCAFGITRGEFSSPYLGLLIRTAAQHGFREMALTLARVKVTGHAIYRVRGFDVKNQRRRL